MKNQYVSNLIQKIKDTMVIEEYPTLGFDFLLDDGSSQNEDVLPLKAGMPLVSGFLYKFNGKLYGSDDMIASEPIDVDIDTPLIENS